MKLSAILIASVLGSAAAFNVAPFVGRSGLSPLFSTVEEEAASTPKTEDVAVTIAKTELLETARNLKDEYGVLIIDSTAQESLRSAVEKLETVSEPPTDPAALVGEWTLLCSTASASIEGGPLDKINGIDTSKIPFFNDGPVKELRKVLDKSLKVEQVIKAAENGVDGIDKVNHIIEYQPQNTLSDFFANIPDALKSFNVNPLQISESKFILVHKAEVESVLPVIKTKLSLQSIVVNVAGKSKILDPEGADVVGINLPFGELLNTGTYETTYMDDKIRVSRSKTGIVDTLRVFIRSELDTPAGEAEEDEFVIVDAEIDDGTEAPSDVEGESL